MAARKRTATSHSELTSVARFPPLPRVPAPPRRGADPRQMQTTRILGAIGAVAETKMASIGPNLSSGFHASAVDLGLLQGALARGIARLAFARIEERWDEVLDWMRRVVRVWVQRCKRLKIERRERGVRVELETQDDHGYYSYGFDVFPRRAAAAASPAGDGRS